MTSFFGDFIYKEKEDSIKMVVGKVSRSDFETNYSADAWFDKFKTNKVAFDKEFGNSEIDILGVIKAIKTDNGCSSIEMFASPGNLYTITFKNCQNLTDKWANEVALVSVGQTVHLIGKYDPDLSSEFDMYLYSSHIVN